MQSVEVSGANCAQCVRAVTDAVGKVDTPEEVKVDLDTGGVSMRYGTA